MKLAECIIGDRVYYKGKRGARRQGKVLGRRGGRIRVAWKAWRNDGYYWPAIECWHAPETEMLPARGIGHVLSEGHDAATCGDCATK